MENGKTPMEYELHERAKDGPEIKNGSNEKAILLDKAHKVSANTAVKLRIAAIAISWVSSIVSGILGVVAIVFAALYGSQSLFSFGLDSILDSISSVVILWRFHGRDTIYSNTREIRACIMIGALFVLSGLLLSIRCVYALVCVEMPRKPAIILTMASINAFCCLVLGSGKIYLGLQLESRALIIDSIITFTGAVMSIFTLIFSAVYEYNKQFWYLDDSFGLLCALFLFGYGIRVIVISRSELKKHEEKEND
ncbi:transmembrane protein 163a-like [Ruditapes philippinarum]|uniref:transmembrane protein 163a-like n=1 Tax=Ruditapes philippinarum TaxID=129788 RepID=UPI00295C1B79|nr:transmembrane protein 163a-like [Ruditapes philippinarum]